MDDVVRLEEAESRRELADALRGNRHAVAQQVGAQLPPLVDTALPPLVAELYTATPPEPGKDGQDGRDGVDGKDGVDGVDGQDGRDGVDGKDGVDGVGPDERVKVDAEDPTAGFLADKLQPGLGIKFRQRKSKGGNQLVIDATGSGGGSMGGGVGIGPPGPPGPQGPAGPEGPPGPGTGGGAVDSVNGQTGAVVLDASDVGADAAGVADDAVAAHEGDTTAVHGIADTAALVLTGDTRLSDPRTPTGGAGGVLSGSYPNPGFAVDMATQGELDAHAAADDPHTGYQKESEKGQIGGYASLDGAAVVPDNQIPSSIARDAEVSTAVAAEATARDMAIAAAIAALINSAPGVLDTLEEIADALGDDPNFAATMTAALAGKQPLDAELTALAGLVSAADKLPYFTGLGAASLATFTAFARTLVDDADAATMRTTLGLGTLATQSGTFSGTSSGTNTGDQTLPTRASLGLATTDSPQFAGLNVGHASDTTLDRASAGVLQVEGKRLFAVDGADVPVADGGTGASTAAAARTNLGLVIGTDVPGFVAITRARTSPAGAIMVGLPIYDGIVAVGTLTNIANNVRYVPIIIPNSVTIDQILFEVTGTPATNANFRAGIYAADTDWQPTGAALIDTATPVANGFTGVKTASVSSVQLPPGRYLTAYNMDVGMVNRRFTTPMRHLDATLGASPGEVQFVAAQTYGAFPNPGTAWTGGGGASNIGYSHCVLFRWVTP